MLDVRRLRVLRSVVTSGSISAAAANLGYTPSAISQQIAALEKEARMPLLEKAGRGVRPTPAGRLLAEHAAGIMHRLTEAETALADLRAGRTGRLRVHYFATAGAALVPRAVATFRDRHPGVRLDLRLGQPPYLTDEGGAGTTDIELVVLPPSPAGGGWPPASNWCTCSTIPTCWCCRRTTGWPASRPWTSPISPMTRGSTTSSRRACAGES
jgi:DNA-binding transcriptional LysR family regulator